MNPSAARGSSPTALYPAAGPGLIARTAPARLWAAVSPVLAAAAVGGWMLGAALFGAVPVEAPAAVEAGERIPSPVLSSAAGLVELGRAPAPPPALAVSTTSQTPAAPVTARAATPDSPPPFPRPVPPAFVAAPVTTTTPPPVRHTPARTVTRTVTATPAPATSSAVTPSRSTVTAPPSSTTPPAVTTEPPMDDEYELDRLARDADTVTPAPTTDGVVIPPDPMGKP